MLSASCFNENTFAEFTKKAVFPDKPPQSEHWFQWWKPDWFNQWPEKLLTEQLVAKIRQQPPSLKLRHKRQN